MLKIKPYNHKSEESLSVCTRIGLVVKYVDAVGENKAHKVAYNRPEFYNERMGYIKLSQAEICDIPWQNVRCWKLRDRDITISFKKKVPLYDHFGARNSSGYPISRLTFRQIDLEMKSFWPRALE